MFLIDSNIIIYSFLPQYNFLRPIFREDFVFVSEITKVEVLGYYKLTKEENLYFSRIFNFIPSILPSQEILDAATAIRRKSKVELGDSIIAATALTHGLSLYTRNLKDFEKFGIKCIDPII